MDWALIGILTTLGPCGGQRLLGLVACTTQRPRSQTPILFALGVLSANLLLASSAFALERVLYYSPLTSAIMALGCIGIGCRELWREEPCCDEVRRLPLSAVQIIAAGFLTSLCIAPCCTPGLLLLVRSSPLQQPPLALICYALGAAVPYALTQPGSRILRSLARQHSLQQAYRIVGATLSLALGTLTALELAW